MDNINKKVDTSCCSCGCSQEREKVVLVEYLYLDLSSCERCIGTDKILDEVMDIITPTLNLSGYSVEYNKVEMETKELAERYGFLSSPTIRVNGKDICASVEENSCGCCSDISGTEVDCRVFEYDGKTFEVPPKEMIANDILKNIFARNEEGCTNNISYELPENLREFFEGKSRSNCSCGGKC